jgi:polyisoprenyl-phosphate glycosyltransferase
MKQNPNNPASPELSIVVPVFREEKNILEFLGRLVPILEKTAPDYEIIFAMDPSSDRTEEVILEARADDPRVKLLTFSRRFGEPMAILAGMRHSSGRAVVVMAADLQDPPEVIPELVAKWREGYDAVLARYRNRDENLVKRVVTRLGYRAINAISDPPIPTDAVNFRLMSRRVVDEVNKLKESHGFLRGLVALVGFRQTEVVFDREARFAGASNYNRLVGSFKIALDGFVCFSNRLLTISTVSGFVIAGGSIIIGIVYAIMKLAGFPFPLGNPTIVILILFMGGIQLVTIGILGEYVGRIYEEVKERPKFILDKKVGFDLGPGAPAE